MCHHKYLLEDDPPGEDKVTPRCVLCKKKGKPSLTAHGIFKIEDGEIIKGNIVKHPY